jgi:hydrogenase maturation protein HypF
MTTLRSLALPRRAPLRVLACGAFLKNAACLLVEDQAWISPVHGDLSDPAACAALEDSVDELLAHAGGRIDAVAHDLHPDFHSSRVAQRLGAELGVPAVAIQHHHAHVAVVQAQKGWVGEPLVGMALDGVGLGHDGHSWGGEILLVRDGLCDRMAHLPLLALPGGDIAAREPWRMASAVLHELGRAQEIEPRFGAQVGTSLARGVQAMLARNLNCPRSSAAGRWFDAAAGALGLSLRQAAEAEAAMALQACAQRWLQSHRLVPASTGPQAMQQLLASLFDVPRDEHAVGEAAARFHAVLAALLVQDAIAAAAASGARSVALGGGCFHNHLLLDQVVGGLEAAGLQPWLPQGVDCGDAGLALGQAWAAALALSACDASAGTETGQAVSEEN